MSRSLARIRNLVSEIEEIHRNGQQGRRAAPEGKLAAVPEPHAQVAQTQAAPTATLSPAETVSVQTQAPFQGQMEAPISETASEPASKVVNIDDFRKEGQVFMRLKGSVALNLQMEDSGETVQVKQIGDMLEIRFDDGKAFHLPLKAVA